MLYPFQDHTDKYGYINSQGEIIIKPCLDFGFEFSEGLGGGFLTTKVKPLFRKAKKKTEFIIFNVNGEIVIRNKNIVFIKAFHEGLAMAYIAPENKWGFIDSKGSMVIKSQFDEEYSGGFSEGLVDVCKNNKWGYINAKGEEIVSLQYDWTDPFRCGFAVVTKNKKRFFIDSQGHQLKTVKCTIPNTIAGGFKERLAVVKIGKKYGAINTKGEVAIEPTYEYMSGFHNGLCAINKDGKYGFIDHANNIVIEPIFSRVSFFHNGISPATLDNKKWGLINENGEFILEPKFDFIHDYTRTADTLSRADHPLLTRANIGKHDFYIDLKGNIIADIKDMSNYHKQRQQLMTKQMAEKVKQEETWDKADWAYDGQNITKKGAIKPIYFVLKWLKSKNLLTPEGIECYKDKNNLGIGLYRFMVTDDGADFLDRFYKLWYESEGIVNFQIDPSLKFEKDENLNEYWEYYLANKK